MVLDPEAQAEANRRQSATREDVVVREPAGLGGPAVSNTHDYGSGETGFVDQATRALPICASCKRTMHETHLGAVCEVCRRVICQSCAGNRCAVCGRAVCARHSVPVADGALCTAHWPLILLGWLVAALVVGGLAASAYLLLR